MIVLIIFWLCNKKDWNQIHNWSWYLAMENITKIMLQINASWIYSMLSDEKLNITTESLNQLIVIFSEDQSSKDCYEWLDDLVELDSGENSNDEENHENNENNSDNSNNNDENDGNNDDGSDQKNESDDNDDDENKSNKEGNEDEDNDENEKNKNDDENDDEEEDNDSDDKEDKNDNDEKGNKNENKKEQCSVPGYNATDNTFKDWFQKKKFACTIMNILQLLKKSEKKSNMEVEIETYANSRILSSLSEYFRNIHSISPKLLFQDANEYLLYIMEHVLKYVLTHKSFGDLFELLSQDVDFCQECNFEFASTYINIDHHLNLNITDSIQSSVNQYFHSKELLPNYYCQKCSKNCVRRNVSCMGSLPKYLILTIKRWIWKEEKKTLERDDTRITVDECIYLEGDKYTIVSMIVHKTIDENTVESGHFYCHRLVPSNCNNQNDDKDQWFCLNDNSVKSISIEEALKSTNVRSGVYLVIYKKYSKNLENRSIHVSPYNFTPSMVNTSVDSTTISSRAVKSSSETKINPKLGITPSGLKNIFFNCYMNSALQALVAIDEVLQSNYHNYDVITKSWNGFYDLINVNSQTVASTSNNSENDKVYNDNTDQEVSFGSSSSAIVKKSIKRKPSDGFDSMDNVLKNECEVKKSKSCNVDSSHNSLTNILDGNNNIVYYQFHTLNENDELNIIAIKSSYKSFYKKFGCFIINSSDDSSPIHKSSNQTVITSDINENFNTFLESKNSQFNFSTFKSKFWTFCDDVNNSQNEECFKGYACLWSITDSFMQSLWTASYYKRDMPLSLKDFDKEINLFHFLPIKNKKNSDNIERIDYGRLLTMEDYQLSLSNFLYLLHFQYMNNISLISKYQKPYLIVFLEKIFKASVSSSFMKQVSSITHDNPWLPHFYMTSTQEIISYHVSKSKQPNHIITPMSDVSHYIEMKKLCDNFCEEMFESDRLELSIPRFVDDCDKKRKKKLGIKFEFDDNINYQTIFLKRSSIQNKIRTLSKQDQFDFKPIPSSLLSTYSIELVQEQRRLLKTETKTQQHHNIGIQFYDYLKYCNQFYHDNILQSEVHYISPMDAMSIMEYYKFDNVKIKAYVKYYSGNNMFKNLINYYHYNLSSEEKCAICQEEFCNTPLKSIHQTICNHRFHHECLYELLEGSEHYGEDNFPCPLCSATCSQVIADPSEVIVLKDLLITRHFLQLLDDIHCYRLKIFSQTNHENYYIKTLYSFKAFDFYCRRIKELSTVESESNPMEILNRILSIIKYQNPQWLKENFVAEFKMHRKCLTCDLDELFYNIGKSTPNFYIEVQSKYGYNRITNFLDEHLYFSNYECRNCPPSVQYDKISSQKFYGKMRCFPKILIFYIPRKTLEEGDDNESVLIPRILNPEKNKSYRVMSVILENKDDMNKKEVSIKYSCNCLMICSARNEYSIYEVNSWVSFNDSEVKAISECEALDDDYVQTHCSFVIYKNMDYISGNPFWTNSNLDHKKIVNLPDAIKYGSLNKRISSFLYVLAQSLAFHDFKTLLKSFQCYRFASKEGV